VTAKITEFFHFGIFELRNQRAQIKNPFSILKWTPFCFVTFVVKWKKAKGFFSKEFVNIGNS